MTKYGKLGYLLFFPLFTVGLLVIISLIPENYLIFPSKGVIFGEEPEAWIGDSFGIRIAGKRKEDRPVLLDVDFIKVKGRWHKIRGPVYITKGGKMIGWHRETTLEETGYRGKRYIVE